MAASTITFNNASDVSVSFLTHRNLQMPVLKNSSEALELDPSIDRESASYYTSFYNRLAENLNEALELDGKFTVVFSIPSDWGDMVDDMVGATSSVAGEHGHVPKPLAGDQNKYLRGDGKWSAVSGGGGGSLTPAGSEIRGIYVDTDGNVQQMSHSVEKSVPSDAKFTDTTYSDMTGAGSSSAGTHGLVPAPSSGAQNKVLSGAGTWEDQTGLGSVSSEYAKANAYAVGDYCLYNEKLYKCIKEKAAGTDAPPMNTTYWTTKTDSNKTLTVAAEISEITSRLNSASQVDASVITQRLTANLSKHIVYVSKANDVLTIKGILVATSQLAKDTLLLTLGSPYNQEADYQYIGLYYISSSLFDDSTISEVGYLTNDPASTGTNAGKIYLSDPLPANKSILYQISVIPCQNAVRIPSSGDV